MPLGDDTQDLRFAVRLLAKERWFTLSAVIALALGIGVNVCVFTIVNGMNLRALPVDRPEQVVYVGSIELKGRGRGLNVSYPDFRDWAAGARTFSGLAAYSGTTMNVGDDDRPADRLAGIFISANAFPLLRIEPILGRGFSPGDDRPGAEPVALIAYAAWNERYGADPAIAGRVIRVNGSAVTVVGVMPEGFRFPVLADIWQPLAQMPGLTGQARSPAPQRRRPAARRRDHPGGACRDDGAGGGARPGASSHEWRNRRHGRAVR